jgi:hypothetical protein
VKHTFNKPRSRFLTVLVVVAPSAILLVGVWLVCTAAFLLSEVSFEPNWIIMMLGIVIVVTMALVTTIFIDRSSETGNGRGQHPPDL